jgi:hypothetical protein
MRRTGLLNGTDAPYILAWSFCRAHADVRRGEQKRLLRQNEGDRVSGVTCSVERASTLAAAPVDWHGQSRLGGNRTRRRNRQSSNNRHPVRLEGVDNDDHSPAAHRCKRLFDLGKFG